MLENLNAERNLFETRLMITTNDLLEDFGGSEIVEHWNDDQIADWKSKRFSFPLVFNRRYGELVFLLQGNTEKEKGIIIRS